MKKLILAVLCGFLIFGTSFASASSPTPEGAASATPAPTSNPTFTPAPSGGTPFAGLISIQSMQGATDEDVVRVQIRLRDLHYFSFKPTGKYQSMTADAAKAFQLKHTMDDGSPMISDGTIGAQTMSVLFRHDVTRADIAASIPIGTSQVKEGAVTGEALPWPEVKALLNPGSSYQVMDYNTGATFMVTFPGGENHAEVECGSAADSAVALQVFGGEYNFSKRAVTVSIDGRQIAASLQGYPHGSDTLPSNDMTGHMCLFFQNSLSHVGSLPDTEHQELVYKASGRG